MFELLFLAHFPAFESGGRVALQVLRMYKQLFEHFRNIKKNKKLRREFESSAMEHKFDQLHDLLCEHDLEEENRLKQVAGT